MPRFEQASGVRGATGTPVIVLGGGLTALGVIRRLGRAGIPSFVAGDPGEYVPHSRWFRRPPGPASGPPYGCRLAPLLERCGIERAVLMPCSDHWAQETARLEPGLTDRFPSCAASPSALETLQDKWRFAEALRAAGVPHPHTVLVRDPSDLDGVPDAAFPGSFLKPRDSQRFVERIEVKAFRVADRADAVARLRQVSAAGLDVVLQEYIPGPATRHFFVDGFVARSGRLAATACRQRLRMYPADFGNSTYFVSISAARVAEAVAAVRLVLERTGYRGIFSAELKHDERDGLFKVLEVNTRPWWYVEFAARCGVDVCAMAYRDALGEAVGEVPPPRVGRTCVFPYFDLDACRDLHRRGELSLGEWAWSWLSAEQPVFRWSDPVPAIVAVSTLLWRRAPRTFRRRSAAG